MPLKPPPYNLGALVTHLSRDAYIYGITHLSEPLYDLAYLDKPELNKRVPQSQIELVNRRPTDDPRLPPGIRQYLQGAPHK